MNLLVNLRLTNSEEFCFCLYFPSDRSVFNTLVRGIKTLRSLRKDKKTQTSSLVR